MTEQQTRELQRLRVRLDRRQVADAQAVSDRAERLEIRRERQVRPFPQHRGQREVCEHEQDHRQVAVRHRARPAGDGEEDRRGHQQIRQRQHEVAEQVVLQAVRPEEVRVDPRHERADPDRQRHREERDRGAEKGAAEAAEHVRQLADLGRADDAAEAGLIVAHHHVADERSRHEHEEQRHDQLDLRDRRRRIRMNVAAAAETDRLRRRRTEGQQEEHGDGDPEHRVADLVAQLEARDGREHRAVLYAAC